MRGFVILMSILVGTLAASVSAAEPETKETAASGSEAATNAAMAEARVFGAGVSAADTVRVSRLLAHPDDFVGKVVRVEGIAVGVCAHRGCWVDIASDVEGQTVRLKVTDGVIVFPPEIAGDVITAEGVWTANQLDLETTKAVCAHEAATKGEKFDPASVTSCMTLYQISGTGAVVKKASASSAPAGEAKDGSEGKNSSEAQPNSDKRADSAGAHH